MNRSSRCLLGVAAAFTALIPVLAHAQAAPAIETPAQIQAKFVNAGFQVEQPITWWTDGSTSFLVHDAAASTTDGRVVMVIVYPDSNTAKVVHDRAAAAEAVDTNADLQPRLVPGYGPSTWTGNVAMVESNFSTLNQLYERQLDRDLGTAISAGRPQTTDQAIVQSLHVEADFIAAAQQDVPTANL